MIFQESQLIGEFTVSQNIFVGNELVIKSTPFINKSLISRNAEKILRTLQCAIDINLKVKELSHAQKKMVEIAKAINFNAKILIMDEPTASLTDNEVENLFNIIHKLKKMKVAIIYISHRIEEVIKISDRIVIIRDGKIIDVKQGKVNFSANHLIENMAGEDFLNRYPKTKANKGNIILKTEGLCNKINTVKNVSLSIRSGEVLGIAGLQGAGKSSLAKLIAGIEIKTEGKIIKNGKEIMIKEPYQAIKHGIIYLSDDIFKNVFIHQDTSYNTTISNLEKVSTYAFLNRKSMADIAKKYIKKLNMKIFDLNKPIKNLNTGTLQKIAISKWLFADAQVFIMDEPSAGLDISSKVELYNMINKLANIGRSVLLISSDVRELIGMCDRILVMFNGSIVKEMDGSTANSVKILYYASGEKDSNGNASGN